MGIARVQSKVYEIVNVINPRAYLPITMVVGRFRDQISRDQNFGHRDQNWSQNRPTTFKELSDAK